MYRSRAFLNLHMETSRILLAILAFFFNEILLGFLRYIKLRNSEILPIKWISKCKVKRMYQLKGEKEAKENL